MIALAGASAPDNVAQSSAIFCSGRHTGRRGLIWSAVGKRVPWSRRSNKRLLGAHEVPRGISHRCECCFSGKLLLRPCWAVTAPVGRVHIEVLHRKRQNSMRRMIVRDGTLRHSCLISQQHVMGHACALGRRRSQNVMRGRLTQRRRGARPPRLLESLDLFWTTRCSRGAHNQPRMFSSCVICAHEFSSRTTGRKTVTPATSWHNRAERGVLGRIVLSPRGHSAGSPLASSVGEGLLPRAELEPVRWQT